MVSVPGFFTAECSLLSCAQTKKTCVPVRIHIEVVIRYSKISKMSRCVCSEENAFHHS